MECKHCLLWHLCILYIFKSPATNFNFIDFRKYSTITDTCKKKTLIYLAKYFPGISVANSSGRKSILEWYLKINIFEIPHMMQEMTWTHIFQLGLEFSFQLFCLCLCTIRLLGQRRYELKMPIRIFTDHLCEEWFLKSMVRNSRI